MNALLHTYKVIVLKACIDMLGHVNNAAYLTLFEEARWDLLTKNGFGVKKIMEIGISPTILEINIRYLKEILLREEIIIETQVTSLKNKIGQITQRMRRGDDICCTAEFTFGILDLEKRKLITPSMEWLRAMGVND